MDFQRVRLTELDEYTHIGSKRPHSAGPPSSSASARALTSGVRGGAEFDKQQQQQSSQRQSEPGAGADVSSSDPWDLTGGNSGSSISAARVPRTVEVEVMGSLVNTCIPGDLLTVVGIVKAIQVPISISK